MVPLYNNGPLRAYYLHKRYAPQTGELWQIVMDANKGSSCVTAYDNVWHSMIRRTVLYRDTSLTIGVVTFSPVIVMREFDTQGGGATAINCDEYFAKNVGLIRRDEYGYNTTVPNDSVGKHLDESKVISRMVITDYFINKK